MLASVATIIGNVGGNIIDVSHHRDLPGVPLKDAVLEVSLETRDRPHAEAIVAALRAAGLGVTAMRDHENAATFHGRCERPDAGE